MTVSHILVESNSVSTGSFADVPEDLLAQIQYLEKIFTVDKAKLKEVTNHFVKELDKGRFFLSFFPLMVLKNLT